MAQTRPATMPDIDPRFLAAHGIVPLGIEDGRLLVAMTDPDDGATIAALSFAARLPVVARAGPAVASAPSQSLFGRIAEPFGDSAVMRWMRMDEMAQRVAEGVTPADALARMRADGAAMPDAIDWAGPIERLADPAAVARQLRAELETGLAVRRALAVPGALLVMAVLVAGWWGLVPGIALLGYRGMPARLATARRTGRAVATGSAAIDRAGEAERVHDRAMLLLAAAEGRVMTAMMLLLAMLAVVRLG